MSALTNLLGMIPVASDRLGLNSSTPTLAGNLLLDATAEKAAIVGCVTHPTVKTGTINIRKVHFLTGAVTINVLSVFRVSLQNISATAGAPYQPDGTQDQTYDFATSSLTASAWNTTGNLSADRAVDLSADSFGDANSRWLCVVFEYQTFTALDSVVINSIISGGSSDQQLGGAPLLNTGSWAQANSTLSPICVLECDDGTFAFLQGSYPFKTISSASVSSTGAIRRAGVKFRVPVQLKIDTLSLFMSIVNASDGRFVLYDSDGTTELISVDMDNDAVLVQSGTGQKSSVMVFQPVTLSANTYYRFVFVGGNSTASTVPYADVNAAAHMDGLILGQDAHYTQHDGTSWTDTTTRRPFFGIGICAVHDGVGGSVALPISGRICA